MKMMVFWLIIAALINNQLIYLLTLSSAAQCLIPYLHVSLSRRRPLGWLLGLKRGFIFKLSAEVDCCLEGKWRGPRGPQAPSDKHI